MSLQFYTIRLRRYGQLRTFFTILQSVDSFYVQFLLDYNNFAAGSRYNGIAALQLEPLSIEFERWHIFFKPVQVRGSFRDTASFSRVPHILFNGSQTSIRPVLRGARRVSRKEGFATCQTQLRRIDLRCVVMRSLPIRLMTGRKARTGRAFHRAPPLSVSLVIISCIRFRDAKFRHNPRTPRLILPWYAGDCFCEYEIRFYSVVELIGRCLQDHIEVQYLFLVI